jgi:prepilin-type N-terminal cleavage/methylation domain-containing protein
MGARLRRRLRARDPESGFTLVELVVAMLLIAIMMSTSLYSVLQGLNLSRDSQSRVVASGLVTGILEKIETTALTVAGFESLSPTTQNLPSQTIQGTTFKFVQTTEWVNRGVSGAVCNSGTNSSLILRATVVATWGPTESVTDSALLAPPNGVLSSSDGSLPVQVDQSNGTGFAGATVTATPASGSATSITTGSDGCAFFAQLTPGNYTVTVTSSGGVDNYERTTWTSSIVGESPYTIQVTAGGEQNSLASGLIDYEQGGTVDWSYTQAFSATPLTPATGMPISIDNPSQKLTDNMYSYPYSGSTSGGLNPVYPDTYAIFAGGCTDADPNGTSTGSSPQPFYPASTYPNIASSVTVTSGGTSTATVPLYPLNLQITSKSSGASLTTATSSTSPTAVAGGGGICNQGTPTYTLNAVSNGISDTAVGLGELVISATVSSGGKTMSGTATVWVKPDGVYNVSGTPPTPSTEIYSFTGSGGSVAVPVS